VLIRKSVALLAALLWATTALASPIACTGVSSIGSVTTCASNQTYGITATTTATRMLAQDGNRTSLWVQCGGSTTTIVTFGDTAVATSPYNGFQLVPTVTAQPPSFYWTNMPQGNAPGRIVTTSVSIISLGGSNPCAFFFTQ
jgi:hypothetical protein